MSWFGARALLVQLAPLQVLCDQSLRVAVAQFEELAVGAHAVRRQQLVDVALDPPGASDLSQGANAERYDNPGSPVDLSDALHDVRLCEADLQVAGTVTG